MVSLLESNGLQGYADRFLQIAYDSGKWGKWMLDDTLASDRDRALIAGHYVFSHPDCIALKDEARQALASKKIELDEALKQAVKKSIYRYMLNFRLVGSK